MQVQGQPRPVPSYKVTQRILSGADVLEEIDWAGKYIPIVPVYGEEVNVEGVRHFRSMIRDAKDEQRRFNFELTSATEMTALAPKAPFIGKKGAFETDQAKWATANSNNWSYIQYDGAEKPERQSFSGAPVAQIQLAMSAADNLKRIIGIHDAGMGAEGNETTGRAILARQKESDTSNFHFVDNLSRAIRHGGRIVLDLIPKVYSTARVIRIIGQDGKQASVSIGSSQPSGNDNAPQQQPPAASRTAGWREPAAAGASGWPTAHAAGPASRCRPCPANRRNSRRRCSRRERNKPCRPWRASSTCRWENTI
jgi:hypothetical protein